jgi:transposase InsO family protein
MSENLGQILSSIYYDTKNKASFGGAQKLYIEAKILKPDLKLNQVKDWLSGELTYTLHFTARRKFKRNKILVNGIDEQWEADLVDMREFSKQNENYNYILTVIDCFSKYAFAVPIKNKAGVELVEAFKKTFIKRKCFVLRTDRGTEFLNRNVQSFLKQQEVEHITSFNQDIKCAIVELFNRTLKSKMFKFFTAKGIRRYIDELPNFLISYNNSKHRTIKMAPPELNKQNEKLVFKNIYGVCSLRDAIVKHKKSAKTTLKTGDKVRKKYDIKAFDKGYYPYWTDQLFTIEKTIKGDNKPYFRVKDYSGNIVHQRFYPEELQKVTENLHRIEKVLKTRIKRGKTEYFVKWLNYPSNYNSWVTDIEQLNNG